MSTEKKYNKFSLIIKLILIFLIFNQNIFAQGKGIGILAGFVPVIVGLTGVKAGINFSNIEGAYKPNYLYGFNIGLISTYYGYENGVRNYSHFLVESELIINQKGCSQFINNKSNFSKFDIDFPLMLKYKQQINKITRTYIYFGGYVSFNLATSGEYFSTDTKSYDGKGINSEFGDLNFSDGGVLIGVGFSFKIGQKKGKFTNINQLLNIDLRYQLGMHNIFKTDEIDNGNTGIYLPNGTKSKVRIISLTASLSFGYLWF